jgi:hypothetical protein
MNKKVNYTKVVLDNLPENNPFKSKTLDQALSAWWVTGRTSDSLRLSEEGYQVFTYSDIAHYDFDYELEKANFPAATLKLGKKIKCPFYIGFHNRFYKSAYIRVYDSKVAMLITLYGTIKDYLNI